MPSVACLSYPGLRKKRGNIPAFSQLEEEEGEVPCLFLLRSEETQSSSCLQEQSGQNAASELRASPEFTGRLIPPAAGCPGCPLPVQRWSRAETGICRQVHEEEEVGTAFKLRSGAWEVGSWREESLGLPQNQQALPLMDWDLPSGHPSW